jgi:hypothetical protein
MEQQPKTETLTVMSIEENITPELIAALSKAQAKFAPALKDAANPFFKSKYAPLDAVWNACKDALAENQLFVSQPTYMVEDKTMLRTRVYHSSGGFIGSEIEVVVAKKNDPQAFGSALTYFRRYELSAVLGIVTDDDDAESAMSRDPAQSAAKPAKIAPQPKAMQPEQRAEILDLLKNPAQTQETVTKVTGNLDKCDYEQALKTILYLKKQIAESAQTKAQAK